MRFSLMDLPGIIILMMGIYCIFFSKEDKDD